MQAERRQDLIMAARRLSSRLPQGLDRSLRSVGKALVRYPGDHGSIRRDWQFNRLRRASELVVAPFGTGWLVVSTSDDAISRAVYVTGAHERLYMHCVMEYLAASGRAGSSRGSFVDVGANIGTSTVDALLHFGFDSAVCLEPSVDNFRLLKANLALNDLDHRASVHHVALSDRDGEALLTLSDTNHGDHRLAGAETPSARSEEVACRKLDTLVEDGSVVLDNAGLVWIDTQGHEPQVLDGAQCVVRSGTPVVIEYCPWALGSLQAVERLERIITKNYRSVVDVHLLSFGDVGAAELDAGDISKLRQRYRGLEHTDLLLLA